MKISVFGLGYVGCVSAACFAWDGHRVIGVDVNPLKVEMINTKRSPIIEHGLAEIISETVENGCLSATTDTYEAISKTDLSFICVGTPSAVNGSLDLRYIRRVSQAIGEELGKKNAYHNVVFRSTMLPGSVESVIVPILEAASGKKAGEDFGLAYNPEFLREGTAIADFRYAPKTVIGEWNSLSGDILVDLYQDIPAPLVRTDIPTAEMVKYADNAYHALKIAFSNEIGTICDRLGIDSHQLMEIFCLDTKLNISKMYLKPGFAFGGSCLPKDLRAINYLARTFDLNLPLLNSIIVSNDEHKQRALNLILAQGKKNIGFLGLSFKEGTDDLRESPAVELIERLIGKGYSVFIYDQNVSLARLTGANKEYIEQELPHISSLLLPDLQMVLDTAEVIVFANRSSDYIDILDRIRPDQIVIDLIRVFNETEFLGERYHALAG